MNKVNYYQLTKKMLIKLLINLMYSMKYKIII